MHAEYKKVGFTGTQAGTTTDQLVAVSVLLLRLRKEKKAEELHHGLCIGSDEQVAPVAAEQGYRTTAHPGHHPKSPGSHAKRSAYAGDHEVRPAKPFLERNEDLVDETDCLVATPKGPEERRSGTWATIRYAKRTKKPVFVVERDGTVLLME
jgi:hypothetical protein